MPYFYKDGLVPGEDEDLEEKQKDTTSKKNDSTLPGYDTYHIQQLIIDKYKNSFIKNQSKVIAVIKSYIAKNSSKLGTRAPTERIPFTDMDKLNLFKAVGVSVDEVANVIQLLGREGMNLSNKVIEDPFNALCSALTSCYFNADKSPNKEDRTKPYYYTSLYLGIKFYGKLYVKFFKKANPSTEIMDYTIENLSNKFFIKKVNNVFEVIKYFSESNVTNMSDRLVRASDLDLIRYAQNIYNRMSNSIKTLANNFYENFEKQNRINTETASKLDEEGDFYVGSLSNISATLETAVRKIILKFVSESVIDNSILEAACSKTKFSKQKMILIIARIRERNDPLLRDILTNIIAYYLLSTKKSISSIRSSDFVLTMIKLYGVSNTKNDSVLNLKQMLNDLIEKSSESILKEGNANMVDRVKNSLYVYLVLFIAKNIE